MAVAIAASAQTPPPQVQSKQPRDLTELSLVELTSMKVTSVSRRPETLGRTPAAVYVITQDEIRRSGARTVPELLRYVPGVDVARATSSQWAIGIRGFTSTLTRSQLVLIDGRSVYSPLFAGSYWDVQNLPLEDVARIEIIRGPGGTLWGANAVNGIINIITKSAKETLGGFVRFGAGNVERGYGSARFGDRIGGKGGYRVYARYFDRDAEFHTTTGDFDAWHMAQAGFRTDWDLRSSDSLTVQGDLYFGREGQRTNITLYDPPFTSIVEQEADLGGGNLRARWARSFAGGSELSVQAYYDRTEREQATFREDRDTFDVDGQYRFRLGGRNEIVAGAGYRTSNGKTASVPTIRVDPQDRRDDIVTAFAEDTFQIVPDRLSLSAGAKLEKNDYSGFEFQPSARLGFVASPQHYLWVAATRAVRTPSRLERDLFLDVYTPPVFARVAGNDDFHSERMFALEGGYRGRFSERLFLDFAAFRNRYPDLASLEPGAVFAEQGRLILPFRWGNGVEGTVSGVGISSQARPVSGWSLRAGYSYLNMALKLKAGSRDPVSATAEDDSPRHSVFVWTSHDLPRGLVLDAWYRWVGRRAGQVIPQPIRAYSELDIRLAWRGLGHLELAAIGRNLLHPHHAEFEGGTEIRRSVHAQAVWRW